MQDTFPFQTEKEDKTPNSAKDYNISSKSTMKTKHVKYIEDTKIENGTTQRRRNKEWNESRW